MKFTRLLLILPCLMFSFALMAGCGEGAKENVVIEAPGMTAEEEAAYEEESYGSMDDEEQN